MLEKAASPTTYSASTITVITGVSFNEWVALAGLGLGIATFFVNWWYKREHLKLSRKSHTINQQHDI